MFCSLLSRWCSFLDLVNTLPLYSTTPLFFLSFISHHSLSPFIFVSFPVSNICSFILVVVYSPLLYSSEPFFILLLTFPCSVLYFYPSPSLCFFGLSLLRCVKPRLLSLCCYSLFTGTWGTLLQPVTLDGPKVVGQR